MLPAMTIRPWGNFTTLIENTPCTVKILTVSPGQSLSLQYHNKRSERWLVLEGNPLIEINGTRSKYAPGDVVNIPLRATHRLTAQEQLVKILEIATGIFDEEDIVRLEDRYGRVP